MNANRVLSVFLILTLSPLSPNPRPVPAPRSRLLPRQLRQSVGGNDLTAPVDSNAQLGNDVSGVMINPETMLVVVGAYRDNLRISKGDAADIDRAGTAWVWFVHVTDWTMLAGPFRLKSPNPTGAAENEGNFGYRVLALENGDVVVTAPKDVLNTISSGAVYRFGCTTDSCNYIQTIIAQTIVGGVPTNTPVADGNFGSSIDADGNTLVIGSSADLVELDVYGDILWRDCGSVFVYTLPEMVLTQRLPYPHTPEGGTCGNNGFGASVSLSGNSLLVGAENDGNVFLHTTGSSTLYQSSGGQYDLVTRVWGDDQGEVPAGGRSGLVFNDGTFIHGAPDHHLLPIEGDELPNVGALYLFEPSGYTQTQKVTSDSPAQRWGIWIPASIER